MGNTIVGGGVVVVDDHLHLLPEDVLIQILSWLPVISLLRFKSVSKSWRDLIQTSFFIDLHTTTNFNSSSSSSCSKFGDNNTFILQMSPYTVGADGWASERKMYMLSFRSGRSSSDDDIEDDDGDQVVFKMDNLSFLPYDKRFPSTNMINMVGSCHGLICLHHSELRDVYLWNPATRQFRILPKSITIQEKHQEEKIDGIGKFSFDFLAFGFDIKTKDYKVVQISRFMHTRIEQWRPGWICRVQVYSLSTDSWRQLEGINYLPACPREDFLFNHGVYLNGCYFFVGMKFPFIEELDEQREAGNASLMFSFDFTNEIFTTMQFPLDHDRNHYFLLTHLGDKIALLAIRINPSYFLSDDDDQPTRDCDDDYENYDIWVLDEQGGKESWAKLHSLRIKERVARERIKPRGILNNGEFALIETRTRFRPDGDALNELHLLNLVTKETLMSFPIHERMLAVDIYKQSLVSIIGGNGTTATNKVVRGAMCPIVN